VADQGNVGRLCLCNRHPIIISYIQKSNNKHILYVQTDIKKKQKAIKIEFEMSEPSNCIRLVGQD
jgi:hypothetical protein